jgi:hypothetical protein
VLRFVSVKTTQNSTVYSHRGCPGSIPDHVIWALLWTRRHWGVFSPNTSVSPANSHSTGR